MISYFYIYSNTTRFLVKISVYKIISTDFCLKERGTFFVNFCFRDSYYLWGFFHVRYKVYKFIQVLFQASNINMNYASWANCFTSQERELNT